SLRDMSLEQNRITGSIATTNTALYARMSTNNQCLGVERIELIVNPSPIVEMQETYVLCTDNPSLSITGPDGFDAYRWIKLSATGNMEIGDKKNALITELGTYVLETGFNYHINGETVSCENSTTFKVLPSNKAQIQNIEIKDFSNNNTVQVEVTGDGEYLYSLDAVNYQKSNLFDNVEPGFVTVYVKDVYECGITEKEIAVMGYPKFFTPNGDGVNDYWQLTGVENLVASDAFIAIYDRYGAFVTQIRPDDIGWNGAANAQSLPASDYWFRINLKDGREFKGHFALKR
ncbi:MAG: T9SS type B sorting domain-containing protein, partial [Flavobacteriaceae bacterium]